MSGKSKFWANVSKYLQQYLFKSIQYDEEVDALYLSLGEQKPNGVIEIAEGINVDTTADGKLTGIEILKASKKINIDTILSYTLELDKDILKKEIA
jgi:uncharacterized protein YuzE